MMKRILFFVSLTGALWIQVWCISGSQAAEDVKPTTEFVDINSSSTPTATTPSTTEVPTTSTTTEVKTVTIPIDVTSVVSTEVPTTPVLTSTMAEISDSTTTTSEVPTTTDCPISSGFDAWSFGGGIILALGVVVIVYGIVWWCQRRPTETPYSEF